jgi:LemA protein
MGYEQETLEKVIRARNQALQATGVRGTAAAEAELSGALRSLFAVVEAYPQLKANESVSRLLEELTSTENRIAFARQFYNDMVMRYNTRLQVIPSNIIASLLNFREEPYFEVPAAEQEPVKVDLR